MGLVIPQFSFARISDDPEFYQWGYDTVNAYEAWENTQGSNTVVVAVLDNGFDTFHPDLQQNAWKNVDEIAGNAIDDDNNGFIDDVWGWSFEQVDKNGDGRVDNDEAKGHNNPRPPVKLNESYDDDNIIHHGTVVAGIIGGVANNQLAGSGISWNVQLMNVRVVGNSGSGLFSPLADAILYAVDNGADIINISMVGPVNEDVKDAVKYAYDSGVSIFAAAGNDLSNLNDVPRYPICADSGESSDWVLGVSAITEERSLAIFSNRGSNCVDITAPGVNIASTMRYAPRFGLTELHGTGWNGTSFAVPFVSGAAALIKGLHPEWGPDKIYETLLETVQHSPGQDETVYANYFGAGLLQIDKAVSKALETISSVEPLTHIGYIEENDGSVLSQTIATKAVQTKDREAILEGITALEQGRHNGQRVYVAVKPSVHSTSDVLVLDESFTNIISQWKVQGTLPLDIAIGDVTRNGETNIVIAPKSADDQLFWVYDINGNYIGGKAVDRIHQGVRLTLEETTQANTYEILIAVDTSDRVEQMQRYNGQFQLLSTYALPISNVGDIISADIDGDGIAEHVISSAGGGAGMLAYYESNGKMKRQFFAYSGTIDSDMQLTKGDILHDGRDEVIVSLESGSQPIRAWTERSQKAFEWKIPKNHIPHIFAY